MKMRRVATAIAAALLLVGQGAMAGDAGGQGQGQGRRGRGTGGPGAGAGGGQGVAQRAGEGRFGGQFGGPGGGPMGPGRMLRAFPIFQALDADKDGVISAEEIENASAALKTLDKNDDGKLTEDEVTIQFPGPGTGEAGGPGEAFNTEEFVNRIMSSDKDGDGMVSKDELPEPMQRMFDRVDTNQDGFIDKAEAEQMAERFSRFGGERAGGPGGQGGQGGFGRGGGGDFGRRGPAGGGQNPPPPQQSPSEGE